MLGRKAIYIAIISFLVTGFIFTSSSAFAYWRQVTVPKDVEIVSIGDPIELIVNDITDGDSGMRLVPEGYIVSVGDVDSVELEYQVSVSRELLNTVDLYVIASNILIGGSNTYSNLVKISIMGSQNQTVLDLYNDTITITVTVQLEEPIDAIEAAEKGLDSSMINVDDSKKAYEVINGQTITFVLGFEVQPKTEIVNNN